MFIVRNALLDLNYLDRASVSMSLEFFKVCPFLLSCCYCILYLLPHFHDNNFTITVPTPSPSLSRLSPVIVTKDCFSFEVHRLLSYHRSATTMSHWAGSCGTLSQVLLSHPHNRNWSPSSALYSGHWQLSFFISHLFYYWR